MIIRYRQLVPLLVIEIYLIATLIVLSWGPVTFNLHNSSFFWLFIFMYHLSFVFGYMLSVVSRKHAIVSIDNRYSKSKFSVFFTIAVFGVLVTYKNLMLGGNFIPYGILDEVIFGLTSPGEIYSQRMDALSSTGTWRILNIISILFLWAKLLFIFYFIYYWRSIGGFGRMLSAFYCLFFLTPGIASGTNSVVFQFVLIFSVSLICVLYIRNSRLFLPAIIFSIIMLVVAVFGFGYIMSQRGGGFSYFALTSPLGDVGVNITTPTLDSIWAYTIYAGVWLNYYLVQGYYGFSLIFDVDWSWTFGFGNSEFLQRQFYLVSGVDISGLTYQAKVDEFWGKSAQWHSFYSQMANDVGIVGLIFLMALLGYYISFTWNRALYERNFYSTALLPVLAILVIFIPANNQVFGFIDTLSYFVVVSLFQLFRSRKLRSSHV
jgi:hypothetical protein